MAALLFLYNASAFLLPLIGIALSAWSFGWSEKGATPDDYSSGGLRYQPDVDQYELGCRRRARMWAKATFNVGALFLAAAVPLGNAASHNHDAINLLAVSGYAIVAFSVAYFIREAHIIWVDRRRDAFNIYFSKEMWALYDEVLVAKLYFDLNPTRFWPIFSEQWFYHRRFPDIDHVAAVASKNAIPGAIDTPGVRT